MAYRSDHLLPVVTIELTDDELTPPLLLDIAAEVPSVTKALRRAACGCLLYADSVVAVGPLSMRVDAGHEQALEVRQHLYAAASLVLHAQPLLDAGLLILVPDPGEDRWVRGDIQAASTALGIEAPEWWNAPQEVRVTAAALYDLRVAAAADGVVVGVNDLTWQAILAATRTKASNLDLNVVAGLGFAELSS